MTALVITGHDNQSIEAATLNTVTAAAQCGGDVHMLVAGTDCDVAAQATIQTAGVTKVPVVNVSQFADGLTENVAGQVLVAVGNYNHIPAPATTYGRNILPRVATKLDVVQLSDITKVDGPDTFECPIYIGNAIATV